MTEYIFCAVDESGEIQWVFNSSKKTRYFRTDRYLKGAVEYHNEYHSDDPWHVVRFRLVEDNE